MYKILKTVAWADCRDVILADVHQLESESQGGKLIDFVSFLDDYPFLSVNFLYDFFKEKVMNPEIADVTDSAVSKEDDCLFYADKTMAASLEIVLQYLGVLGKNSQLPSCWCYLDIEKRAVVHFVQRNVLYAEMYCLTKGEEYSVLHIVEAPKSSLFIPVVFTKDLSPYAYHANLRGQMVLRNYLPRDIASFLSKRSHKPAQQTPPAPTFFKRLIDNGDDL